MVVSLKAKGMPLHRETWEENAMALRNATWSRPTDALALPQADHYKVRQLFWIIG